MLINTRYHSNVNRLAASAYRFKCFLEEEIPNKIPSTVPTDAKYLSETEVPFFPRKTKTRLGEGNDPYALIDEAEISRDHPLVRMVDLLHELLKLKLQQKQ